MVTRAKLGLLSLVVLVAAVAALAGGVASAGASIVCAHYTSQTNTATSVTVTFEVFEDGCAVTLTSYQSTSKRTHQPGLGGRPLRYRYSFVDGAADLRDGQSGCPLHRGGRRRQFGHRLVVDHSAVRAASAACLHLHEGVLQEPPECGRGVCTKRSGRIQPGRSPGDPDGQPVEASSRPGRSTEPRRSRRSPRCPATRQRAQPQPRRSTARSLRRSRVSTSPSSTTT